MVDILNTKKRDYQYNGPVDSSDYNLRIDENYRDLVYLYNKIGVIDNKLYQAFERVIKENQFLIAALVDMEDRVKALESASNLVSIHSYNQLDYASFTGTSFAITANELLSFDPVYNVITLPKVSTSSYSKLKFSNSVAGQIVPDFFKAKIVNNYSGVDTTGAVLDSTPIYNCILDSMDKVWKRTIISDVASPAGAQMMVYIKVPAEAAGSLKANFFKINPYPAFGTDVLSIEYTTNINPTLSDSDGWTPLNRFGYYNNTSEAIGKVPPGGWTTIAADAIRNSGPLAFVFPDTDITAFRVKLVQRNYFMESGKYIYTYGLSDLDIRYDKFMPNGRMMIKYTPPNGDTISDVLNVTPKIYNVPLSSLSGAFSYRVIYDDAGTYTLSNPGISTSVWIEVTLNMLSDKTAPVLSDLIIEYI